MSLPTSETPDIPIEVFEDRVRAPIYGKLTRGGTYIGEDGLGEVVPVFFADFFRPEYMNDLAWQDFVDMMRHIACGKYVQE